MDLEKKRRRIARNAAINGWCIVVLAALCLLGSLLSFSLEGILVGGGLMVSGCMELSGRRRLKQNRPQAGRWLAGSQLVAMGTVLLYCAYNLLLVDPKKILMEIPPAYRELAGPELILKAIRLTYLALIAGTLVYQGGLCLYYTLSTRKLARAMAETPKG
jgi:uncharacterized membrane protein HdeD (DUF308 family)